MARDETRVGRLTGNVYTTPPAAGDPHCEDVIAGLIDGAKASVHFAIFTFTSAAIAGALTAARSRGIDVRGAADSGQWDTGQCPALVAAGMDIVRTVHQPALMHQKILVVDGLTVALGSYNWTVAANTRNDEILLVLTGSARLVAFTLSDIDRIRQTARAVAPE